MRRIGLLLSCLFTTGLAFGAAYRVENVPLPSGLRGGISGVAFTPAGSLVLATRYGEIWMRSPDGQSWHRFARGLNEPMGVVAESESVIDVSHRPELLRMIDTDGDGEADKFDALGGDWGLSNNYHEFFFGLRRDRAGNFYGAVSLDSSGEKKPITRTRGPRELEPALETSYHNSEVPYRGWAIKITPDGRMVPLAAGLRQPNGVGLSPEGELFVTDNQGDYKPSCGLIHVEQGDFLGHAESLKWEPGFKPGSLSPEVLWHRYKPQAVAFPFGVMGVSAGEPVWDVTHGRFGPFSGQVFVGDFTNLIMRVCLERVGGEWQGAVFAFLGRNENASYVAGVPLAQGNVRMAFAPDGSLYIGQTGGWGGGANGLQRVVWEGQVPPEVKTVRLTDRGFAVTFTTEMDRASLSQADNYELNRFRYYYQMKYGSPRIDQSAVPLAKVRPGADGRSVELVPAELAVGYIYELSFNRLVTAQGENLANPLCYYTANRLRDGEVAVGGTTRLPRPGENALGAKEAQAALAQSPAAMLEAGEKVYKLICIACHQANGKGIPGGAANFVDDKSRLAKSDKELLKSIANGVEGSGMPAFGSSLTKTQQRAVLYYIRQAFGDHAAGEAAP